MTQASDIVAELDRLYLASVARLKSALTRYLTDGTPGDMARILALHEGQDRAAMRSRAREAVAGHAWSDVAQRYLELFRTLGRTGSR